MRSSYCAIRDPSGLQAERAETADRRDQITKDVSVMRFDHAPVKGFLHRVRQVFPLATEARTGLLTVTLVGTAVNEVRTLMMKETSDAGYTEADRVAVDFRERQISTRRS